MTTSIKPRTHSVLFCSCVFFLKEYLSAVEAYHQREDVDSLLKRKPKRSKSDGAPDLDKEPPVFKNGGALRDYQREVNFGTSDKSLILQ